MAITVKHKFVSAIPDAGDTTIVQPSNWNDTHELTGLGTMAEQDANAVAITGGTISGVAVTGYVPTTETITAGTGLTGGGDLSANRTIALANTAVTTGTYGNASRTITQTVDQQGRLTNIFDQPIEIANTQVTGLGTASIKDAGAALGVATLDAAGKVPLSEIPDSIIGALSYQGTWNATTNTPTLTSSVGTKGYYYVVSVAGTTDLNGITDWQVGDWAVYSGTAWQKIDNTDGVTSVNGFTGAVTLTTTNIAEGTNLYYTDARARAALSAGTAISYNNTTGVITNSAPDQVVALTGAGTTTVTGTYPNFTITSNDQYVGTVTSIGGTGTVSGISLSGTVTSSGNLTLGGSLDLSSPPVIGGTTPNDITGSNITANTKFVSENYYAQSILGGNLRTSGGTSLVNWDGGGSGVVTVNGGLSANPSNKNVSLAPTGTGSVTINPATAGTMNNMVIGGTTPLAITGTTITATSFVGSGASLTNVVNSATAGTGISVSASTGAVTITNTAPDQTVALSNGTGIAVTGTYPNFTITNTAPSSGGTVTSVTATAPVASTGGTTPVISMPAATTSVSGYLTNTDWTTFNSKAPAVTYTTNYIPYGQGTTTPNQSSSFTFDGTTQTAPIQRASNGIIVNSKTVSASYSIASGDSAMSVGPVTVASGQTVTVASGSRWVVL